ncbi:MAG: hypothetical protein KJZ86_00340 [Caldilineaceae bacterium]|mgnify:CR=1 FL=1|nr:hypothetical protein [Caldilineaceae bacterium]HRJ40530.1 hypothetical protein [Caldilineaceae bacterium]
MMTREEFDATIVKLRAAGQDDEKRRLILKDIPLMERPALLLAEGHTMVNELIPPFQAKYPDRPKHEIILMVHKHLDRYSNRELTYEQLFETI